MLNAGRNKSVLHARLQIVKRLDLEGLTPVDHIAKSEHVQPFPFAFRLHRPESLHIHPANAIVCGIRHRIPPHHHHAGLNAVIRPDVGRRRRPCRLLRLRPL